MKFISKLWASGNSSGKLEISESEGNTANKSIDLLERLVASTERQEALLNQIRDRMDWQCQKLQLHSQLLSLIADETRIASDPKYRDVRHLGRHVAQVYSQATEDCVLSEILDRVGPGDKKFVEIGLESGRENTTRFLLEHCNWTGIWIEGDPDHCQSIRERFAGYLGDGRLKLVEAFVTAENIGDLIEHALPGNRIDLLSIDIDRNTSHVWNALKRKSRIAVIEYNASIPPNLDWEIDYDPQLSWDGTNVYGASLKALERIGRQKNMALVGCDARGINAFFVDRDEDLSSFREPFDAETHFEPVRFAMIATPRGHPRLD